MGGPQGESRDGQIGSHGEGGLTRRAFGRRVVLAAPAVVGGAVLANVMGADGAEAATAAAWQTTGNSGTSSGTNFLGTTDNKPLVVRTNNAERLRVSSGGSVGIGLSAPTAKLHVRSASTEAELIEHTATSGAVAALHATAASADAVAVAAQNKAGAGTQGVAVQGLSASGAADRIHPGGAFFDGAAEFCGPNGVIGAASTDAVDGYGVLGIANNSFGIGVAASSSGGAKALVAFGDADIFGTLTKSGGSFRIDHPLAPASRYLSHSFVESPDMKNVYDGVITTDENGAGTVTLPDWFAALNRDVRYQLTAISAPAPDLHVAEEFNGKSFAIAGAQPGQKISWQITGIRHDAWADANRISVESDKPARERGRFLHPELFGADASARVGGAHQSSVARSARGATVPTGS